MILSLNQYSIDEMINFKNSILELETPNYLSTDGIVEDILQIMDYNLNQEELPLLKYLLDFLLFSILQIN